MEVLTTPSKTKMNPHNFKDHEHLKWQTTMRATIVYSYLYCTWCEQAISNAGIHFE